MAWSVYQITNIILTALSSVVMGAVAIYFSYRQNKRDELKKNDFLYTYRMNIYSKYFDALYKLEKLNCLDVESLRNLKVIFGRLQYEIKMIFDDEDMFQLIKKIQSVCKGLYDCAEHMEGRCEKSELEKLQQFFADEQPEERMQKLFSKYIKPHSL